jgi:hypothetical protein
MTTEAEILKSISDVLSPEWLLWPIEFVSEADTFEFGKMPEKHYVDNGRADIVTKRFESPIQYNDKTIVGYTIVDKYQYGRENKTWKKFTITLYEK